MWVPVVKYGRCAKFILVNRLVGMNRSIAPNEISAARPNSDFDNARQVVPRSRAEGPLRQWIVNQELIEKVQEIRASYRPRIIENYKVSLLPNFWNRNRDDHSQDIGVVMESIGMVLARGALQTA